MVKETMFAVVRKSREDLSEFILPKEMSFDQYTCRDISRHVDAVTPQWAKENPVVRIVKVKVKECPSRGK